jgi:Fur family ferric uptake transcriptional regulator
MSNVDRQHLDLARDQLRNAGARLTSARARILAQLIASESALSHAEVQRLVDANPLGEAFDRVTLYRVLYWLVEAGLAHRITGQDRVYRYSVHGVKVSADHAHHPAHAEHGHFRCKQCARMFCLPARPSLKRVQTSVPEGFEPDSVELTVLGRCADCVHG